MRKWWNSLFAQIVTILNTGPQETGPDLLLAVQLAFGLV
jgi:hypothetical protein